MTKKISCRVVKSVPLSKNSEILRHISRPAYRHHKVGKTAAANVNYTDNPAKTAGWLCVGKSGRGQILDCYV